MHILTPHHRKLIRAAVDVYLPILLEHHEETSTKGIKSQAFIDMLQCYADKSVDDITLKILDDHTLFEGLIEEPDKIWELGHNDLLIMQLVILKMLPDYDWPIAKKSLYERLQQRIEELKLEEDEE